MQVAKRTVRSIESIERRISRRGIQVQKGASNVEKNIVDLDDTGYRE